MWVRINKHTTHVHTSLQLLSENSQTLFRSVTSTTQCLNCGCSFCLVCGIRADSELEKSVCKEVGSAKYTKLFEEDRLICLKFCSLMLAQRMSQQLTHEHANILQGKKISSFSTERWTISKTKKQSRLSLQLMQRASPRRESQYLVECVLMY